MPPKPRPKTPRSPSTGSGVNRRLLVFGGAAAAGIALIAVIAVVALGGGDSDDGSGTGSTSATAALKAAGCTVVNKKAITNHEHSVAAPDGTSTEWNTDPPTSGPHYQVPAIWGAYTRPLGDAQVIHNLEHGGVFIRYGTKVPTSTVEQLRAFYDEHTNGTVMGPRPSLGDQVVVGAWVAPANGDYENAVVHLAKCTTFDDEAFSAFFDAYQFKGPERFDSSMLLPGNS